jgi:hypothetical protein
MESGLDPSLHHSPNLGYHLCREELFIKSEVNLRGLPVESGKQLGRSHGKPPLRVDKYLCAGLLVPSEVLRLDLGGQLTESLREQLIDQ